MRVRTARKGTRRMRVKSIRRSGVWVGRPEAKAPDSGVDFRRAKAGAPRRSKNGMAGFFASLRMTSVRVVATPRWVALEEG